MRRLALIVSAGVLLAAGGIVAVQSWRHQSARRSEINRIVSGARSLAQTEAGISQAKIELDRALELTPDDPELLVFRGEVLLRLARHDDAIRDLRRAIELTDGNARARSQLILGRAFFERYRGSNDESDFRSARSAFQDARLDPASEAEAMHGYAILFLEKGKFRDIGKAITVLDELLKKHPDYPDAPAIRELLEKLQKVGG